jgi:hypothetical protein
MPNAQHTPGPWKLDSGYDEYNQVGIPFGNYHAWLDLDEAYAAFNPDQVKEHHAEIAANTRLIAAAPDLYAALEHMVIAISISNPIDMMQAHAECDAALRKARGTS